MFQKLISALLPALLPCFLMAQKPTGVNPPVAYPQYAQPPDLVTELREGLNLSLGMNIGGSKLYHGIDFERTPLLDAFNFIKAAPSNSDYEWETFVADYQLRNTIVQPRFGFSALLTYAEIPAFVLGEFMSSTSSYQKMSFGATVGLGKDLIFGNDNYISFKGGYKVVFQDGGFGSETLVNSIGNDEGRKYLSRFFDPKLALGAPRGDMMAMRLGVGKYMGRDRKTCVGIEMYGELDLTNETLRIARMNTLGLNAYMNFVLF